MQNNNQNVQDQQIEELQKKVSYLENYTDELNSVILDMRNEIETLSKSIDEMQQNLGADDTLVDPNEKPPHY